jgi:hypothetical protein
VPDLLRELRVLADDYATNPALLAPGPGTNQLARGLSLEFAFQSLGENARSAAPELASLLKQGGIPLIVAPILKDVGGEVATAAFTQALTNRSLEVRYQGAHCMGGNFGTNLEGVMTDLIACLHDESEDPNFSKHNEPASSTVAMMLRISAATDLWLVGTNNPARAVPALLERLQSEKEAMVRGAIARSLGKFGTNAQSAIPALRRMTNGPNSQTTTFAIDALKAIETKPGAP